MTAIDHVSLVEARRVRRVPGSTIIGSAVGVGVLAGFLCWCAGLRTLGPAGLGTPGPGDVAASLAQLAGLVASVLVCLQVLLVARVPWLVRAVGVAAMVSWHRRVGTSLLILIVGHVLFAMLAEMLLTRRTLWSELIIALQDPGLLRAIIGTALIVGAGLTSARIARSRLPYEWWYAAHLTVYLGIFLSFAHQVNAGVHFVDSVPMRMAWTAMYLLTAVLIIFGRVLLPCWSLFRQQVRVERVVEESAEVASVWLTGRRLDSLRIRPGQFFFIRFLTPGHLWAAHPYSVSLLPSQGRMRITIGAVGDHSGRARHLMPGTRVLLEGPFGSFCAPRSRVCGALLIAGGSGIGPIVALARELCRRGRDVVLIQRASAEHQLPLREEIAGLELTFLPVVGRREQLGHDPLGGRR